MNLKLFCTITAAFLLAGFGCAEPQQSDVQLKHKPEGKILIAYYSQSGTKNTKTVAQWIQNQVGGDLFEITMVKPYSDSYYKVLKEAKKDLDGKITPAIKPCPLKIEEYDLIFIGSPVWYGTFAPPVGTLLKAHSFAGKKIVPFCTHGGGGAGRLYQDMADALPKAKVLPCLTMRGSNVVERTFGRGTAGKSAPSEVINRLNEILP